MDLNTVPQGHQSEFQDQFSKDAVAFVPAFVAIEVTEVIGDEGVLFPCLQNLSLLEITVMLTTKCHPDPKVLKEGHKPTVAIIQTTGTEVHKVSTQDYLIEVIADVVPGELWLLQVQRQ